MRTHHWLIIIVCVIGSLIPQPATTQAASKASILTTGAYHSCVVVGGSVYCWGKNLDGQLGNGTTTDATSAVLAQRDGGVPLTNVTAIAAGDSHTCALVKTGQVYCWGLNDRGQLGDGTTNDNSDGVLAQLSDGSDLTNVTAITASGSHTCALTKAKIVYCWGYNGQGQIGDGTITDALGGVQSQLDDGTPLTNVTAIGAGRYHTCALTTAKVVYCWGFNDTGQLGNNDGTITSTTGGVLAKMDDGSALTNITAISTGEAHTCALTKATTVYCWGSNSYGILGNNDDTYTDTTGAVAVEFADGSTLTGISSISAGYTHNCAISKKGLTYCWGNNAAGQLGIETFTGVSTGAIAARMYDGFDQASIQSVSAGGYHSCIHTKTKAIYCWGDNTAGQLGNGSTTNNGLAIPVQYAVNDAITKSSIISVGSSFACTTTKTGQAYCWGKNGSGQLGAGTTDATSTGAVPVVYNDLDTLSSVTAIASGPEHACTVTKAGTVYCWGRNNRGQLGDGTTTNRYSAVPATIMGGYTLSNITSVTAGDDHTCARTKTGYVYCWGRNNYGQLGNGTTTNTTGATLVRFSDDTPLSGITGIEAGYNHTCAYTKAGAMYCWGTNAFGQLGNGDETLTAQSHPTLITTTNSGDSFESVTAITAGEKHTCALTKSRTIYCWGFNSSGQLGDKSNSSRTKPVLTKMDDGTTLTNVVSISATLEYTCAATKTGQAYCWGDNDYGQLGNRDTVDTTGAVPVQLADGTALTGVTAVAVGGVGTCALTKSRTVYCWGVNSDGQLGNGTTDSADSAVLAQMEDGSSLTNIAALSAGESYVCAITKTSTVYCWGDSTYGQLGNGTTTDALGAVSALAVETHLTSIKGISAGLGAHACAITKTSTVYCWGDNDVGQLGNGDSGVLENSAVRTQMHDGTAFSGVSAISTGLDHTCALTKTGQVYCWGGNGSGQVGNGTIINALTGAVLVQKNDGTALTNVKGISAGANHSCAYTKTGQVYCWGLNTNGELGDGSTTNATGATLTQLADGTALTNVVSVSAGNVHSCALTKTGQVYCWGGGGDGQLGDGNSTDSLTGAVLAQMADGSALTSVSTLSAGYDHTCVTTKAGAAYCWGSNVYGQLGNGDGGVNAAGAVAVHDVDDANLAGIKSISAGAYHNCATDKSAAVYCWGLNDNGQLGDGTTTNRDVAKLARMGSITYITGVK